MKEWVCKKCGSTEIALKYKGHINFAFDEDGYITATDEEYGDGVDETWCECGCCGETGADIEDIADLVEFKQV